MKLIADVDQKCIDNGLKEDCNKCPIALALLNIDGVTYAEVRHWSTVICYKTNRLIAFNDSVMCLFMYNFDFAENAVPTKFTMDFGVPSLLGM